MARPVIGPLKEVRAPFRIIDWKAAPVLEKSLSGSTLPEILISAMAVGKNADKGFFIRVKRSLKDELKLMVDGIFQE